MNSDEIERRLRLPAPDEPAVLPALSLPSRPTAGLGDVRGRVGWAGQPIGTLSPRLAVALLALVVALVAAIASGALRLNRTPTPLDSDGAFGGRGVSLTYPEGWVRLTTAHPGEESYAFVVLIVATAGVAGCSEEELPTPSIPAAVPTEPAAKPPGNTYVVPVEDRMLACLVDKPMAPGEIRVVVSHGIPQLAGSGPIESFDPGDGFSLTPDLELPTEADGWTRLIDGMPAKLVVKTGPTDLGADETRIWAVHAGLIEDPWFIRATIRGPDLQALRTQADTVAQSLRFDEKPPALDQGRRDAALGQAVDSLDRGQRQYPGSRMFGCFPRTAGERDVQLTEGPGGPLLVPVSVTCRTTVEPTLVQLWRGKVLVTWPAGEGYASGEWGQEFFFHNDGQIIGLGQVSDPQAVFPGTGGPVPPPASEPLVIPIGSVVQLLPPGIDQAGPAYQTLYQRPNATIGEHVVTEAQAGRRFAIVDGPVTNEGTDWYLADLSQGTSYPSALAWLPATDRGRPLLRVVEPTCPSGSVSVADLLYLLPAERVSCFGNAEMTLDPVIAALADAATPAVEGTPAWLAKDTRWRLFGPGGVDGLDGGLPVAIPPDLGRLPTDGWLVVRGHFDDAASSTCTRTVPEVYGSALESAPVQVQRCRELFVVTSFDRRGAP